MKIQFALFLLAILIIGSYGRRASLPAEFSVYRSNCTTPDGVPGKCMVLKECLEFIRRLKTIKQKSLLVDYLKKSICETENVLAKVCCLKSQSATITETISTTAATTPLPIVDNNAPLHFRLSNDDEIEPEHYKLLSSPECGITNVPQKGIFDGRAELGAWPWIAALGYTEDYINYYPTYWICVGALITSRHVLTAAHCTDNNYLTVYKVRLGQINVNVNTTESGQSTDVFIERITPHPSFKRGDLRNDIAILRLVEDVQFSKNVQPICLPIAADLRKMSFFGHFGVVAGWGASNKYYQGVPVDPFLRQLQLPIIDNEECQRAYLGKTEIYSSQMCAGFRLGGKGACQGDSGGPLIWKKGRSYYSLGILSFGMACGEVTGNINGLTRITSFLPWIEEIIKSTPKRSQTATVTSTKSPLVTAPSMSKTSAVSNMSKTSTTNGVTPARKIYELPSPPYCGIKKVPGVGNNFGTWPWVTALGFRQNRTSPTKWLCTGHLITSRHVITVGHCTKQSSLTLYKVRLGIDDLHDNVPEGTNAIDMDVENIILHPSYTGRMHIGDIAIIKLKKNLPLSNNIQPVCLPKSSKLRDMPFINAAPTVTGWGDVRRNGTSKHQSLQKLQIPTVSNEECNRTYARKRIKIDSAQICAGLPRGACLVDSGDPLIWPNSGAYYLLGLVSYAFGCAQPGYPDIFTRITSYLNWVEQNINK